MKLKAIVAVALFALGMVTAVAIAKPPPGAKEQAKLAAKAAKAAKLRAGELECRGGHMNFSGTVASIDLSKSEFVLNVVKANRQGRDHVGKTATIVVGDKTKMRPKPRSGLDKLAVDDRVVVLIRKCRDDEGDAALMAKLVVSKRPAGREDDDTTPTATETTPTTTTSP